MLRDNLVTMYGRPVKLEWAGWSTDTYRLGRAGWSISADQDICTRTMMIAISHPEYQARGVTRIVNEWLYEQAHYAGALDHLEIPIGIHLGKRVEVHLSERPNFVAVDYAPSIRREIRTLEDLAHFAPMKSLDAPFVLPEQDVDQLLSLILEKQQKAKTDYFRDLVKREGSILPAHTMAAQIISLKAA